MVFPEPVGEWMIQFMPSARGVHALSPFDAHALVQPFP